MTQSRSTRIWPAVALAAVVAWGVAPGAQDQLLLREKDAPPDGIWLDSLDLTGVPLRAARGRGGRAGEPATPPPVPTYALGGVTYPHVVPLQSDRDFAIDIKGQALRFQSMVGIDDAIPAGRGSVILRSVGGRKEGRRLRAHEGGDAPKPLSADLTGARRLVLAVTTATTDPQRQR